MQGQLIHFTSDDLQPPPGLHELAEEMFRELAADSPMLGVMLMTIRKRDCLPTYEAAAERFLESQHFADVAKRVLAVEVPNCDLSSEEIEAQGMRGCREFMVALARVMDRNMRLVPLAGAVNPSLN